MQILSCNLLSVSSSAKLFKNFGKGRKLAEIGVNLPK